MIVRKESIVIVAGYDAMGISSKKWKYGIFISPMWRQWIARAVYKLAKNILVVSGGLIQDLQKNGINITDKFHVVYFGYDVSKFNVKTKKKYILTVGVAKDQANYYRKGYDRFFKIASALPDFTFMAVGLQYKPDDFQLPDNVLIEPEMHNEGVRSLMAQAQCYMQLSRAEGLCNSVAEAMLSGCHVITSDCQGMAELNPGGNIYTNDENIIYAILNIMRYPGHRERNRDFIIKNFTLSTRARIINRLLKNT
jgi:glycosyltransferase involved in cell wall biosynthesis